MSATVRLYKSYFCHIFALKIIVYDFILSSFNVILQRIIIATTASKTNHGIIPPLPSGIFRVDSKASDSAILGAIFSKICSTLFVNKRILKPSHAKTS